MLKTRIRPRLPRGPIPRRAHRIDPISKRSGYKLVDREARRRLSMSGEEFIRQYRSGQIENPERSEVQDVIMLLPFAIDVTK